MVDGKNEYIVFTEEHAKSAEILNNMSPQQMSGSRVYGFVSRLRSKSFTQLDPSFFMVNFTRDIQGAFAMLSNEHGLSTERGRQMVANTIKDSTKNLRFMLGSMTESGKQKLAETDPEYAQLLEDFEMDGGKTGWGYAPSIEELAKELDNVIRSKRPERFLPLGWPRME